MRFLCCRIMSELAQLQTALDQKRQELSRLENELKSAQREKLSRLPSEHGYETADELIQALAEFASPQVQAALRTTSAAHAPGGRVKHERKKRVVISDALRQKIAAEIERGRMIAAEIASKFDVSVSTINQMKQKLGAVKKRAKPQAADRG